MRRSHVCCSLVCGAKFVVLLCFAGVPGNSSSHVIACYVTNWAQYRPGIGAYSLGDLDPYLCTDLVYAFASIDTATFSLTTTEWNDLGRWLEWQRVQPVVDAWPEVQM